MNYVYKSPNNTCIKLITLLLLFIGISHATLNRPTEAQIKDKQYMYNLYHIMTYKVIFILVLYTHIQQRLVDMTQNAYRHSLDRWQYGPPPPTAAINR